MNASPFALKVDYHCTPPECFSRFVNCTNAPATLLKSTLLHRCFPRSLYCTDATKLRNASQITIHAVKSHFSLNSVLEKTSYFNY